MEGRLTPFLNVISPSFRARVVIKHPRDART